MKKHLLLIMLLPFASLVTRLASPAVRPSVYRDASRMMVGERTLWEREVTAEDFWVPELRQVRAADRAIQGTFDGPHPVYRLSSPLRSYRCQYLGSHYHGHRTLRCFFTEKSMCRQTDGPESICDGGDSVFEITYDLDTGRCFDFRPNGLA
jgi:hypothetical protein